jgi:hypothetical protein
MRIPNRISKSPPESKFPFVGYIISESGKSKGFANVPKDSANKGLARCGRKEMRLNEKAAKSSFS